MPVYKVKVTAFIEAASEDEARERAFDSRADLPGQYLFGEAPHPEELGPDRAAAVLEFAAMLKMAGSYPREEYVELDRHPGVRFSPPAAAALRRLRNDPEGSHGEDS